MLKARLKTVGVSEYKFHMEAGSESGTEWRIIDVGGSRSQVRFNLSTCALTTHRHMVVHLLFSVPLRPECSCGHRAQLLALAYGSWARMSCAITFSFMILNDYVLPLLTNYFSIAQ